MEEMARAMGSPVKREAISSGKVGGRQPGSITKAWRRVLASLLLRESDWFDANAVVGVVQALERRNIRASEVRRIFKKYEENGYVEHNDGSYRITDEAVAKFGLDKETQTDANPNENEEAGGDAVEPSDGSGPDAGTSEPLDLNSYRLVGQNGG